MSHSPRREKPAVAILVCILCLLQIGVSRIAAAQQVSSPAKPQSSEVTLHSSSNLVLVPVIALKNSLPIQTLKREDFQIFDDGRPVSIATFDNGAEFAARPLALWFVVLCNMKGYEAQGSGVFRGQTALFKPALSNLEKWDTVAVAHWCDDGQSKLDVMPTADVDQALSGLEQALVPMPDTRKHDRDGELALQNTLQQIVDTARASTPEPISVVIFLYGDWSGMGKSEANHLVDEILQTSGIAFGIRDRHSPHMWFLPGEQKEVAHYIAAQTGGEYFDATADQYSTALGAILQQLHFRYELGFKPGVPDGKRHLLRVTLSDAAKNRYQGIGLKYRAAYTSMATSGRP
jgi:hypothetical protein